MVRGLHTEKRWSRWQNPDCLKAQNLVFRSHPQVDEELREPDMMRLVFQKDHSGCCGKWNGESYDGERETRWPLSSKTVGNSDEWISRKIKGMDLARLGDLLGWGQVRIYVTHSSLLYFRLWASGRTVVIYWGWGQWGKGWRACGWRAVRSALHVITSDLCAVELFPPHHQFLGVRVS